MSPSDFPAGYRFFPAFSLSGREVRESDVEIAESGLFKGPASIEEAEIHGRFEGNLVVRKRLLIKASGRVSGTIRYGQIEIECGGQISGDVQAQPSSEHAEVMPDVASVRVAS